MTPASLDPFPGFNMVPLKRGARLYRFHDPAFDGAASNPCKGGFTRFAPLARPVGDCLPTLCGAQTLEAAVWESIFHDAPYVAGSKAVRLDKATSRVLSLLELQQDLVVAPPHEPDLIRIGFTKTDLIETAPTEYIRTARWAKAFHRSAAAVAGLQWTSHLGDPDLAYVFFEDRAPAAVWTVLDRRAVATDRALLSQIRSIGERAEITLSI